MGVGIRDSWEEIKMKTIGFPISHKENENRRALLPEHIINIEHPECLWFETACVFERRGVNKGYNL